jgi:hypothetical protein
MASIRGVEAVTQAATLLLDGGLLVGPLDGAEPYGLLGDLVAIPARRALAVQISWLCGKYRPRAMDVQSGGAPAPASLAPERRHLSRVGPPCRTEP